jgi:3-mercaptopyruvate sulfurtransferase SseA
LEVIALLPRLIRRLKGPRVTDGATLKQRLESAEEVALIDVRTPEEFRGPLGHITGARNIPIAELSEKIRELNKIKEKPIITI